MHAVRPFRAAQCGDQRRYFGREFVNAKTPADDSARPKTETRQLWRTYNVRDRVKLLRDAPAAVLQMRCFSGRLNARANNAVYLFILGKEQQADANAAPSPWRPIDQRTRKREIERNRTRDRMSGKNHIVINFVALTNWANFGRAPYGLRTRRWCRRCQIYCGRLHYVCGETAGVGAATAPATAHDTNASVDDL